PPASSPLCPYTTLFRSLDPSGGGDQHVAGGDVAMDDGERAPCRVRAGVRVVQSLEQLAADRDRGIERKRPLAALQLQQEGAEIRDRKSTRLNSSHLVIS